MSPSSGHDLCIPKMAIGNYSPLVDCREWTQSSSHGLFHEKWLLIQLTDCIWFRVMAITKFPFRNVLIASLPGMAGYTPGQAEFWLQRVQAELLCIKSWRRTLDNILLDTKIITFTLVAKYSNFEGQQIILSDLT